MKAIVLLTGGTVPAIAVSIGHHGALAAEPAVDVGMGGLLSVKRRAFAHMTHRVIDSFKWPRA